MSGPVLVSAVYNHTTALLVTTWDREVVNVHPTNVTFTTALGARRALTTVSSSSTFVITYNTTAGVGDDVALKLQAPWSAPFVGWVQDDAGHPNDPIVDFDITQI